MTQRGERDTGRRRRGVRAGLDLEQILSVASSIPAAGLTMQAVADQLGVDRKAVNHHVSDRETLVRLVALDGFGRRVADIDIPDECDWQEASRIFGRGIAAAMTALGPLAGHVRFGSAADRVLLATTEKLLEKLMEGGLDPETAVRAVSMLGDICDAHGRGVAMASLQGIGQRHQWLRDVMAELPAEHPTHLEEVARSEIDTYDERQLEVSLAIFISGVESLASR